MGDIITWIIAIPIVAVAIYILVKNIRGKAKGDGCDGCSGCSGGEEKPCDHN